MKTNPSGFHWMLVNPARRRLWGFISLSALLIAGCTSTRSTTDASQPSVLIAVQVAGGAAPTPAQSAKTYRQVSAELIKAGYRIADRTDTADFEVVATITPDAIDPTQGAIKVSDVHPIQRRSNNSRGSIQTPLQAAQERQNALDNWGKSREAPAYSTP